MIATDFCLSLIHLHCVYNGLKSQDLEILLAIFVFFLKNDPLR